MITINRGNSLTFEITPLTSDGRAVDLEFRSVKVWLSVDGRKKEIQSSHSDGSSVNAFASEKDLDKIGVYSIQLTYEIGGGIATSERVEVFTVADNFFRNSQGVATPQGAPLLVEVTAPHSYGRSAYRIAVDNGFQGTEYQWVTSLKEPAVTAAAELTSVVDQITTELIKVVGNVIESAEVAVTQTVTATNQAILATNSASVVAAEVHEVGVFTRLIGDRAVDATEKALNSVEAAVAATAAANIATSKAEEAVSQAVTATGAANTAVTKVEDAVNQTVTAVAEANTAIAKVEGVVNQTVTAVAAADTAVTKAEDAVSQAVTAVAEANTATAKAEDTVSQVGPAVAAANTATVNATAQGDYAKAQGDYAKIQGTGIDEKISGKANLTYVNDQIDNIAIADGRALYAEKMRKNNVTGKEIVIQYLLETPNDYYTHTISQTHSSRLTDFGESWNSELSEETSYTYGEKGVYLVTEMATVAIGIIAMIDSAYRFSPILVGKGVGANTSNSAFQGNVIKLNKSLLAGASNITSLQNWFQSCGVVSIPVGLFDKNTLVTSFGSCLRDNQLTSLPIGLFDKNTLVTNFFGCFLSNKLTSIPPGLFDKNTLVVDFDSCFRTNNLTSIPTGLFDNNTLVTNFSNCFYTNQLTSLPIGLFDNNTLVTNFSNCFYTNQLTSIPTGLFDNNTLATSFGSCLRDNQLTSLPIGLFDKNTLVTNFFGCFLSNKLTSIPPGLFDNNTLVTNFSYVFNSNQLTSIPTGLFDNNTLVTSFVGSFQSNRLTSLPVGLFDKNTLVTNFSSCFRDNQNLKNPENLTSPGKKRLWERDGDEDGVRVTSFSNFALGTHAEFRAGVPTTWGGTMATFGIVRGGEAIVDYSFNGEIPKPIPFNGRPFNNRGEMLKPVFAEEADEDGFEEFEDRIIIYQNRSEEEIAEPYVN